MAEKVWSLLSQDLSQAWALSERRGIPLLAAAVAAARGLTGERFDDLFEDGRARLWDPLLMRDLDRAAAAVREAVEAGDLICVFGDYDCDGICSTAIVYDYLVQIGARVCYRIPNREREGYGLNKTAIRELAEYGVRLLLTVDNGVSAIDEINYANGLGLRVVVTDHHEPRAVLPAAAAVVDPHRPDCAYPDKDLCGAGVAFKLLCALEGETGHGLLEAYGDLLAIATVADVVSLTGENRVFVRRGLQLLRESERCGLRALLAAAGLAGKPLTADSVAFGLAPRMNAAGRIDSAETAVELLLTEREGEAQELAALLDSYNLTRREQEAVVIDDIAAQVSERPALLHERILVLDGEGYNAGIVGIVCSRLVERFGKPCIIIAREGETAKASGRSIPGFSLIDAVSACAPLLTHYGGHPMAAGFSLMSADIPAFRAAIAAYAAKTAPEMPPVELRVDCVVSPSLLTVGEVQGLAALEPFGCGNEPPVFAVCGALLERVIPLSEGRHCKLRLSKDGEAFFVLCFSVSADRLGFSAGDTVDVAFSASLNEYQGTVGVALRLRGIRLCGEDLAALHRGRQTYEACLRGEKGGAAYIPDREEAAAVYRWIRAAGRQNGAPDALYRAFCRARPMDYVRFCVCIDAMEELQLLRRSGGMVEVVPDAAKVDFGSAAIIRRLSEHGSETRDRDN